MKPTQILIEEHNAVLLALQILEKMEAALKTNINILKDLSQLLDFFKGFVDRCHHGKEEEVLFPEMEKRGVPREGGPIGVMLHEHEVGRGHIRAMSKAFIKLQQGESDATTNILEHGQAYRDLLRAHINKENNVLFPMANRFVPENYNPVLIEKFDEIEKTRIGEGKHEAFHNILLNLKDKYGIE